MSASMKTILIFGATSGIGENFARRWHGNGKKVIITGRRQDRLESLKRSLPGLETYPMDNTDLASLPKHVETLFSQFPAIDTVLVNSGSGHTCSIKEPSSTSDNEIIDEITLNVTAPIIIGRHVVPRLLAQKNETAFMVTGSGLGFTPWGSAPVYAATKAAVHHYLVGIRQTLQGSNVNVIEIVAPAVKTDFGDEKTKSLGGMEMQDFMDEVFGKLDKGDIKSLKEVTAGSAEARVQAWRGSIGMILEQNKIGG